MGVPAGDAALCGGDFDGLGKAAEKRGLPVAGGDGAAAETGRLAEESVGKGGAEDFPAATEGVAAFLEDRLGGKEVALGVVDVGPGGEEVPEVVVAPEHEGDGVVESEVASFLSRLRTLSTWSSGRSALAASFSKSIVVQAWPGRARESGVVLRSGEQGAGSKGEFTRTATARWPRFPCLQPRPSLT